MANPKDRKYSKQHTWAKVQGDIAVVGITDFAQGQLADIVLVELPAKGKEAKQGKSIGVIESVKSVSEIFSPVSGQVIDANAKLKETPGLINKDAFGQGWIVKIKAKDKKELDSLLSAGQYEEFIRATKH